MSAYRRVICKHSRFLLRSMMSLFRPDLYVLRWGVRYVFLAPHIRDFVRKTKGSMTSQKQTDASGYEGLVWGEDCFPGIDCPAPFYVG